MSKPPARCRSCQHTKTQHLQSDEGCWGGTFSDCGCKVFDDGRPTAEDRARQQAVDAGLVDKERGMGRALLSHADWQREFRKQVWALAVARRPFTSEDVVAVVGLPSGEVEKDGNNAVGAMMNACARDGWIRKTGNRVLSTRRSSHAAELTEWVGGAGEQEKEKEQERVG